MPFMHHAWFSLQLMHVRGRTRRHGWFCLGQAGLDDITLCIMQRQILSQMQCASMAMLTAQRAEAPSVNYVQRV